MHFDTTCIHDFQINTTPLNISQHARMKLNKHSKKSKEINCLNGLYPFTSKHKSVYGFQYIRAPGSSIAWVHNSHRFPAANVS